MRTFALINLSILLLAKAGVGEASPLCNLLKGAQTETVRIHFDTSASPELLK